MKHCRDHDPFVDYFLSSLFKVIGIVLVAMLLVHWLTGGSDEITQPKDPNATTINLEEVK